MPQAATALPFDNRAVLVTGATGAIGQAIAVRLAAGGARVAVHGRSPAATQALARSLGTSAVACSADLLAPGGPAGLLRDAVERLGRLDALVNNAGATSAQASADVRRETWDRILRLNLTASFECAQASAAHLGTRGAIVNIASVAAYVGIPARAAYAASKAGLLGLTRVLAAEWAPAIRVNAIVPGYVRTPLVARLIADGDIDEDEIVAATPMGRIAVPDDVASAVTFLLGDDARLITGQTLTVDGGWVACRRGTARRGMPIEAERLVHATRGNVGPGR